jgi:hypothetical protein
MSVDYEVRYCSYLHSTAFSVGDPGIENTRR